MNRRFVGAVLLVFWTTGCYSYAPTRPRMVSPGEDVRIMVDAARASQLEDLIGQSWGRDLEGTVVARVESELLVAVPVTIRERGMQSRVLRQQLRVGEQDILSLEVRELDWTRTGAVLGLAGVALAVVIVRTFSGLVGGSGDAGPPPAGPQLHPAR